jgi:hypothetical protein
VIFPARGGKHRIGSFIFFLADSLVSYVAYYPP